MTLSASYDPKQWETQISQKWEDNKVGSIQAQTAAQQNSSSDTGNDPYTVLMPPPNLTGNLHAGHAFQHFLMDTMARIARQNGQPTLWQPGVDHAGIQMEGVINKIFKSEGKDRDDISDEEFLAKCWEKASEWRDNQKNQARVLGDTPDYDRELFTLDPKAVDTVNYAFKQYYDDGLIYKGAYLVNWSVGLQTALSDVSGEIEYEDRTDPFITFFYKFESISSETVGTETQNKLKEFFTTNPIRVATVRPETIYGDVAIAIHPEKLVDMLTPEFGSDLANKIKAEVNDNKLEVFFHIRELGVENMKLILTEKVEKDFGTGALKITPVHDQMDYDIFNDFVSRGYLKPGFKSVVGRDGLMKDTNHVDGQTVEEARLNTIRLLIEHGYVPLKEVVED